MEKIEFNNTEHIILLAQGYQFIEMYATGIEVRISEDCYLKEVVLIAHKNKPENSVHYILDINDDEVADMACGTDTDIFFIQKN